MKKKVLSSLSKRSESVQIVEMALRDGLQNEKREYSLEERLRMLLQLSQSGLSRIEIGAFVSSQWVPQMKDSKALVMEAFRLQKQGKISKKVELSVLVPNEKGMLEALETPIREVAVFTGATESFTKKNINCSIEESFKRFEPVFTLAKKNKIKVRAYISVAMGCPYEGEVSNSRVLKIAERLYKMGAYEISVGDTLGVATPNKVRKLFQKLSTSLELKILAGHFHDTYHQAVANTYEAYNLGVRVFDSSWGGKGGCPYAPGAQGNVATEDLVYLFDGLGVKTGVNRNGLQSV
ncbi:MAG TPA: hydroxymethylglutaryl-CoA lyase [Pseudobdellovibrionaceae bacterium]|nr:hydroxymethylglutaryl-CoA lyase [Pseudobdellovibrionaceae bacterium]